MFAMTPRDKRELDEYRKLGTLDEIRERLANPYPQAEEGFAPRPSIYSGPDLPDGQYSGLLEDDDFEQIPGGFDSNTGALIAERAEDEHYDPDWEDK